MKNPEIGGESGRRVEASFAGLEGNRWGWAGRHPVLAGLCAVLLALLVGAGVWLALVLQTVSSLH